MLPPRELFRIVDFQRLIKIEPRQDQGAGERALSPSGCVVHLAHEQEFTSRNELRLFLAELVIGNPPSRFIELRERCFLSFAGNGRDHYRKPDRRDARDSGEDEAETSQRPARTPRGAKTFDAQIHKDWWRQQPQKHNIENERYPLR